MPFPAQIRIPATYMRGGTSKGVFFRLEDLPESAQVAGPVRDALLLRVIGSPDPYGKHTDGMGAATSSTSKTVQKLIGRRAIILFRTQRQRAVQFSRRSPGDRPPVGRR